MVVPLASDLESARRLEAKGARWFGTIRTQARVLLVKFETTAAQAQ